MRDRLFFRRNRKYKSITLKHFKTYNQSRWTSINKKDRVGSILHVRIRLVESSFSVLK